jgi:large subunit ribosomal protein L25
MSQEIGKLTVELRTGAGKGVNRRLRSAGKVPGVIYGKGVDPVLLAVDAKALKKSLDPAKKQNTVIHLSVTGGQSYTVMLKDYEFDKLRNEIEHVDLLAIDVNKEVHVEIPLVITGKAKGIVDGGMLTIAHRSLKIICKPADIPAKIDADVTALGLGDALHVADLQLPEGVRAAMGGTDTIASIVAPREEKAAKAEVAEAAAPGAAPAGAAAKAGDAKAAAPAAGKEAAKPAAKK